MVLGSWAKVQRTGLSVERAGPTRCGSGSSLNGLQGYLAHDKTLTPLGLPQTLGTGLLQGPRGLHFLVSEVPL